MGEDQIIYGYCVEPGVVFTEEVVFDYSNIEQEEFQEEKDHQGSVVPPLAC
jgi:hypothetical protein